MEVDRVSLCISEATEGLLSILQLPSWGALRTCNTLLISRLVDRASPPFLCLSQQKKSQGRSPENGLIFPSVTKLENPPKKDGMKETEREPGLFRWTWPASMEDWIEPM